MERVSEDIRSRGMNRELLCATDDELLKAAEAVVDAAIQCHLDKLIQIQNAADRPSSL